MRILRLAPAIFLGWLLLPAACAHRAGWVDTSDPGITARFKAELKKHPEIDVQALDIDTHDGVITLSGIVASEDARYGLVKIARDLKGVRQVMANLLIRQ